MDIKGFKMTPLTIALISFLTGSALTAGVVIKIKDSAQTEQDVEAIIKSLETEFQKAQASAVVNLTETDLLKIPCSEEYIERHSDLLCREMFCRMNRQGDGDSATETECLQISKTSLNLLKINTCMAYWDENTATANGLNLNSQFGVCLEQFKKD